MALIPSTAAAVLLTIAVGLAKGDHVPLVEVTITQKYLEPLCVNGISVKAGQRRWRLEPREHALTFTMRNEPRLGTRDAEADAGVAAISFSAEPGHRYEVETRAPASTYSLRVWKRGEWQPVVRDRTADRIVSTGPEWRESRCRE